MRLQRNYAHSSNPGFDCRESVIIIPFGRSSFLARFIELFHATPVPMNENTDREVFQIEHGHGRVTLLYSGMGGPAIVNALEMVKNNGARRVVLFGACGGMNPALGVGHLLIPYAAVRAEGASRYYLPAECPAVCHPGLSQELYREARTREAVPSHLGLVYTTDASYRQKPEVYQEYGDLVLGADCECAAAAGAGLRLGLEIGALFFCTDNVTLPDEKDRRYKGFQDERVVRGFEAGARAVLRVMCGGGSPCAPDLG